MTTQRQTEQADNYIQNLKNQNEVFWAYTDYVADKVDMGEVPMNFDQWRAFEQDQSSPISKLF